MFKVENGPHIRDNDTTSKIMTRLLIALVPIVCFAIFKNTILVYFYTNASFLEAMHPLFMIIVSILVAYLGEFLWFKFIQKNTFENSFKEIYKSKPLIPGLLLALVLPVNTPLLLVAFGSFCAVILGKMLFGGFGQNIFNPALIGYLLISVAFSSLMGGYLNLYEMDTIAGSTPLTNLAQLNYFGGYDAIVGTYGTLTNFLFGSIPGALGEVSKILIIVGFIYLTITKTIKWKIPVFCVGTVFILTFILGYIFDLGVWYPLFHILSGGLLFGAVFMATDPVTSPLTSMGQIFYGVSLGLLTVALRFLTPYPEGVMTSILFMNILVFLFDKIGLKLKYSIKKIWIYILIFILISVGLIFAIENKIPDGEVVTDTVEIIEVKEDGNKKIYSVTSKGWGIIKADVEVSNGVISSIIITDSTGETQWSEIENANYIYEIINKQDDIDNLDAISGSTYTSNGLKNIIKKIRNEESSNEKNN